MFSVDEETAVDVLKVAGEPAIEQLLVEAGFKPVKPEDVYRLG